ncbi:hypothetical protein NWI01_34480 [Nitrobacter winogradskyi]|uniref:Uncharacterized protein n=1 Tax=Nitrobacter winogradskyi TaxID=913 RepID=A0A4Y3WJN2_NITWI|nr:hypothetical protein NWI01_34480 [Nitrobacter winogradskyi]
MAGAGSTAAGKAAAVAADVNGGDMKEASGERGRIGRPDALSTRGSSPPSRLASSSQAPAQEMH